MLSSGIMFIDSCDCKQFADAGTCPIWLDSKIFGILGYSYIWTADAVFYGQKIHVGGFFDQRSRKNTFSKNALKQKLIGVFVFSCLGVSTWLVHLFRASINNFNFRDSLNKPSKPVRLKWMSYYVLGSLAMLIKIKRLKDRTQLKLLCVSYTLWYSN